MLRLNLHLLILRQLRSAFLHPGSSPTAGRGLRSGVVAPSPASGGDSSPPSSSSSLHLGQQPDPILAGGGVLEAWPRSEPIRAPGCLRGRSFTSWICDQTGAADSLQREIKGEAFADSTALLVATAGQEACRRTDVREGHTATPACCLAPPSRPDQQSKAHMLQRPRPGPAPSPSRAPTSRQQLSRLNTRCCIDQTG